MLERHEQPALISALVAAAALLAAVIGRAAGAAASVAALLPVAVTALLVSLLVWLRLRLARRAREEQAESASVRAPEDALFAPAGEEGEPFSFARTQRQFERWVVGAAAPMLAVLQGVWAWQLWRIPPPAAAAGAELRWAALWVGLFFAAFILSRYQHGLARAPERRGVRAAAGALGLLGWALLLAAGAAAAAYGGWPGVAVWVARGLIGLTAALAVENVGLTLLQMYRPRGGEAAAAPFESRLAQLLTAPRSWMRGASRALDYQFGVRLSETWVYDFLRRSLVPLALLQFVALYLYSGLVFIGPEEEAIRERFGRPLASAAGGRLLPGAHFIRPWPFETVRRFPARRLQRLNVGFENPTDEILPQMLWTRPHYAREDLFLVANRNPAGAAPAGADPSVAVNLVSMNVPVEFRVTNGWDYVYRHQDPARQLRQLAYRTLAREAAGRGLFDLLGPGHAAFADAVRARLQAAADAAGLGVEVSFVGLRGLHPPVAVAEAFEAVIGAVEEKDTLRLGARAHRSRTLPRAAGEQRRVLAEAQAARARRQWTAAAEADQFLIRRSVAQTVPELYRRRLYLETVRRALGGARMYLSATRPDAEVLQFNFEEAPGAGLFDFSALKPGAAAP